MAFDFGDIDFAPGGGPGRGGSSARRPTRRGSAEDAINAYLESQRQEDSGESDPWARDTSSVLGDPSTFLNGSPMGGNKLDAFYSAQDVLGPAGSWTGWNAQRRIQLQLAMQAAGLLGEISNLGVWTSDSQAAFEALLTYANQSGSTWQDALAQLQQGADLSSQMGVGGAAGLDPTVITLPNPEDLNRSVEEFGMSLTGERLDDDLRSVITESLLDSFRTQQERQLQTELTRTGSGPFVEHDAPDPNRLLEDEIRERAPQKVMNKQTRDAMEVWFEMIGEPL